MAGRADFLEEGVVLHIARADLEYIGIAAHHIDLVGVHHLGFLVDDVDSEVAALVKDGAKLLIHDPGRFAYVDAGGPGGAIFELMAKRT